MSIGDMINTAWYEFVFSEGITYADCEEYYELCQQDEEEMRRIDREIIMMEYNEGRYDYINDNNNNAEYDDDDDVVVVVDCDTKIEQCCFAY